MDRLCNAALLLFFASGQAQAMPSWATRRAPVLAASGIYQAVCSGTGPSPEMARSEALQGCKSSVVSQLSSSGEAKTISIETETDVSIFQEISEAATFKDLICSQEREEIEEVDAGSFRVWLLCSFDLKKVQPLATEKSANNKPSTATKASLSTLKDLPLRAPQPRIVSQDKFTITLAVVPFCSKLLIRGARPRTITCQANPVSVVLERTDTEMIVIAPKAIPKTLPLNDRVWSDNEVVQVILETH